jgi:2',3'-cyclic-nucleotide 2'-phosphodiesterase (5'-nucleotidase family)
MNLVRAKFSTTSGTIRSKILNTALTASNNDLKVAAKTIDLLSSPNTDIWDMRSQELQFGDNAQTIAITADGQNVQSVRPLLGTRTLTARTMHTIPTSDAINGLNFPNTVSMMDFPSKQIRTAIMAFTPRNPNPSDLNPSMFLLGEQTITYFGPGYGTLFTYSSPAVTGGRITLNDTVVTSEDPFPVGFSRISVQTLGICLADSIACDRNYHAPPFNRTFYGNYSFLFLSETIFSDTEITLLNSFVQAYTA